MRIRLAPLSTLLSLLFLSSSSSLIWLVLVFSLLILLCLSSLLCLVLILLLVCLLALSSLFLLSPLLLSSDLLLGLFLVCSSSCFPRVVGSWSVNGMALVLRGLLPGV